MPDDEETFQRETQVNLLRLGETPKHVSIDKHPMKFRDRIILVWVTTAVLAACLAGCKDDRSSPPTRVERFLQPARKPRPKEF